MKRNTPLYLVTSTLLLLLASTPGAGSAEMTIFDAPRGGWLGSLRADAGFEVLEERDGWRRIRLEAWVPAGSGGAETAAPSGSTSRERAPIGHGATARIRGVLQSAGGDPPPASVVLLVSDLERLDQEHARAGAACSARLNAIDARLAALEKDYREALNSSDNFRVAATRSDRIRDELRAAESDRARASRDCRDEADALFQRHAARRTISDAGGRYEFDGVNPGRYRVIATRAAEPPVAWAFDCPVEGGGTIVLDPGAHRSAFAPYWDLR